MVYTFFDITNFEISSNNITSTDDGIYLSDANFDGTPTTGSIINNMVSSGGDALYADDLYLANVWHNTFVTTSTSTFVYAFRVGDNQPVDVRNNIMVANQGEAFFSTITLTNYTIDNNIYYSNGTVLIDAGTNAHADLASWQADQAAVQCKFTRRRSYFHVIPNRFTLNWCNS